MLTHVADPGRRGLLMQTCGPLVSLGRMTERLHPGGQYLCGGSVRLGGMALGRFQPLAACRTVPAGAQSSLPQFREPRADGVKAVVDLLPTARPGAGLTLHASQHA